MYYKMINEGEAPVTTKEKTLLMHCVITTRQICLVFSETNIGERRCSIIIRSEIS